MEKITYSTGYTDGGSPFWASHRRYDPLGSNAAGFSAIVEDDGDTEWETPCAQITVNCYVKIDGDHDFYDVNITMDGGTRTKSLETGTNLTTGGLSWHFSDFQGNKLSHGGIRAVDAPQAIDSTRLGSQTYVMRIQNGVTTKVGFAAVAGGIQISPTSKDYYINVQAGGWVSVVCQITNRVKQTAYFQSEDKFNKSKVALASLSTELVKIGGNFEDAESKASFGELVNLPDKLNYDARLQDIALLLEQSLLYIRENRKGNGKKDPNKNNGSNA